MSNDGTYLTAVLVMISLIAMVPFNGYSVGEPGNEMNERESFEKDGLIEFEICYHYSWVEIRDQNLKRIIVEGGGIEEGSQGEEVPFFSYILRTKNPIVDHEIELGAEVTIFCDPFPWIPPTVSEKDAYPDPDWDWGEEIETEASASLEFIGMDDEEYMYNLKVRPVEYDHVRSLIYSSVSMEYRTGYDVFDSVGPISNRKPVGDIDYLIVTGDDLVNECLEFAEFKASKGILSMVVSVGEINKIYSDGDNASRIRRFVQSIEQSTDLDYLLLAGDHDVVPTRLTYNPYPCNMMGTVEPSDFASDSYYSCVDKDTSWDKDNDGKVGEHKDLDDVIPDLAVGRIGVNDENTMDEVLNSLIQRESLVSVEGNEKVPVFIAGDPGMNPGDVVSVMEYFWEEYGEDILPYHDSIYFDGTGNLTFSTEDFIEMLEADHQFMGYFGHGKFDSIPDLADRMDISGMKEDHSSGCIFAMACVCGMFDDCSRGNIGGQGDCFAEAMTESPGKGVVGFIGASRLSVGAIDTSYSGDAPGLMEDYWRAVEKAMEGSIPMTTGDIFREAQTNFAGSFFPFPDSKMDGSHRTFLEYNLLGDPEAPLILSGREELVLRWDLNLNSSKLQVRVTDTRGIPVNGANVTLFRHGELGLVTRTDAGGYVNIILPESNGGIVQLSACGSGYFPNSTNVDLPDTLAPSPCYSIDPAEPDGRNGIYMTAPVITISGDEIVDVEWSWDHDQSNISRGPISISPKEGDSSLRFRVKDLSGHTSQWVFINLTYDGTDPRIGILLNPPLPDGNSSIYITKPLMSITSNEDLMDPSYSLDGGRWISYSGPVRIGEGVENILVRASDPAGNIGFANLTLTVDQTHPVSSLEISNEPSGLNGFYTNPPTVRILSTDSDLDHIEYRWDDGEWYVFSDSLVPGEGEHILNYRSIDRAGNIEPIRSQLFLVDTKSPGLTVDVEPELPDGLDGFYVTQPIVYSSSEDPVQYLLIEGRIEGDFPWSFAKEYIHNISIPDGIWTIVFRAQDPAGNFMISDPVFFKVDTKLPDLGWEIYPELPNGMNGYYSIPPKVTVISGDEDARLEYSIDGIEWIRYVGKLVIPEGTHSLLFRAVDEAGNIREMTTGEINVDITMPEIEFTFPPEDGKFPGEPLLITWDGYDSISDLIYRLKIDQGYAIEMGNSTSYLLVSGVDGHHSIRLEAIDLAGNLVYIRRDIYIDSIKPTVIAILPDGSENPRDIVINVSFSEPIDHESVVLKLEGDIMDHHWEGSNLIAYPEYMLENGRDYTIHLEAMDVTGNEMDTFHHTFSIHSLPEKRVEENENGSYIPIILIVVVPLILLLLCGLTIFMIIKKQRSD